MVRLMSRYVLDPIRGRGCNQRRAKTSWEPNISSFMPPQPRRQRTLKRPRSPNCPSTARYRAHDARPPCPCRADAERCLPPSSSRSICSFTSFHRHHPVAAPAKESRYRERCTKANPWRLKGPGSYLPEPVRPSWCRSEERDEIWRLAQDEGNYTQGPRLGV